jgi:hypothetical protein
MSFGLRVFPNKNIVDNSIIVIYIKNVVYFIGKT